MPPARKKAAAATFSADERKAMRERAKELKAEAKAQASEQDVLDQIAAMPKADRELAARIHRIVREAAPGLEPRTWYGMPAYARDGKVVCFFQAASKFKARYATFGFNDAATLDQGELWPTAFALTSLTPAGEKKLRTLVRRAVR